MLRRTIILLLNDVINGVVSGVMGSVIGSSDSKDEVVGGGSESVDSSRIKGVDQC